MLLLQGIKKDYQAGDTTVHALKGIDLAFRKSEFVSILGPSGCGKTTLLNIIGGLDHYTDGELFIDGVSTKKYTDRDWDNYRNHSIGFIFQSYNLIPHQTISENVELALSISGVDKAERVKRAHEALDRVGLAGQYNKKPNQLSGGQCQRVAIARALVNQPDILLADEPTGALDTETGIQVMELIREIAKDRLVIMVTHNPELAKQYSTRTIELLDGEVIRDSDPFSWEPDKSGERQLQTEKRTSTGKKAKLSFWSAFKLSARNLLSKFKRTFLVCLAGSIGIIGVATVLAVSSGVQNFIRDMQDDMLSGNPLSISTEAMDTEALLSMMTPQEKADALKNARQDGEIRVQDLIGELAKRGNGAMSAMIQNDITQDYLDYVRNMPKEYYNAISALYGITTSNNLYTDFDLEGGKRQLSLTAALAVYTDLLKQTDFKDYATYIPMFTETFRQAPDDTNFILSQYDIISDAATSHIPTEADEIMVVVNQDYALTDLSLAQFGYLSQEQFLNLAYKAVKDLPSNESAADKYDPEKDVTVLDIDALMNKTFTWYPNDTVFSKYEMPVIPGMPPMPEHPGFTYTGEVQDGWNTGKTLKVTAVLRRKEGISYGCLNTGFYYTSKFAQEVIADGKQSEIVQSMLAKSQKSITTYDYGETKYGLTFEYSYQYEGEPHSGTGIVGSQSMFASMLGMMAGTVPGSDTDLSAGLSTYTITLRELGGVDTPNTINIYPTDFKLKANVRAYLDSWNGDGDITVGEKVLTADDRSEIKYTDTLELIIGMISTMINIVTAALIAFTALSLVVSTVMIAIITYVSVIERVKEIGVIRSLGGRKRDVSALFNAETFIIGTVSGLIGIAVTYIISAILNLILGSLFGIYTIAALPIWMALIMIAISIALTLISGLVPASLAAKKDPVDALRTE